MRATRLHRLLAGEDGPGKRALPAGEFLHPIPLLAVVVLMFNDHWLKGAGLIPPVITGKLSDVAGLLFFPLLVTAVVDVLLGLSGRYFSLTPVKLAVAVGATGVLFITVKLSAAAARTMADVVSVIGFESAIVADPTDLIALPMLGIAYWLGQKEIRRVPLGRIQLLEARWHNDKTPVVDGLQDVIACGADAATVAQLASGLEHYFAGGAPEAASAALARLRG